MNTHLVRACAHRLAGLAVVLAASMGLAQVAAATPVSRVYIVEVPPAEDHAFNVGVQAWEKCLRDHGARQATYAFEAQTGDLSRYLFLNQYSSWGGMDAHDAAGMACRDTFGTAVLPHVSGAVSNIAVVNAKDTYMPGGDPDPPSVLWADAYRIKAGQEPAFNAALEKLAAAAAKTHWQGHFIGHDIMGAGKGGADFIIAWPNKSWADVGQDPSPSARDMMDRVYGAAAAESLHRKFVASIAEHWSESWSYDKDLSFIPGK
ncbi:MAG: hypothetical protein ACREVO_05420 [Steroidobacteraceae bacterium]